MEPISLLFLAAFLLLALAAGGGFAGQPERATVWPRVIDDVLSNPGIGFTTQSSFDGDVPGYPTSTLAYWRWYWEVIEPEQGQYRWDIIDQTIETARARGQRVGLGVMPANGRLGVPRWYRESGANGFEYTAEEGPVNWMPDHNDPRYVEHMGRLVRTFGERYDGHPDVDHVDMRSLGHWGEWHFFFVKQGHPECDASPEVRRALVDMYLESFRRTPLLMLIGAGEELRYATERGAGWRADCLGDVKCGWNHMAHRYQQAIDEAGANDVWQHAPVAFESCWTMQHWADQGWDIEHIFHEALRWHCSIFNNKSSPVPPRWWGAVEAFQKRMGYRLALRYLSHPLQVAPRAPLALDMEWENLGVAPPYRRYPLAFRISPVKSRRDEGSVLVAEDVDVTSWLPGTHRVTLPLDLPAGLAPGAYRLALALLDPHTQQPAVQLAIQGRDARGWYGLTEFEVAKPT